MANSSLIPGICLDHDTIRSGKGCTRIAFQNAWGINYHKTNTADDVIATTRTYDLDILDIAEPNSALSSNLKSRVNATINQAFR